MESISSKFNVDKYKNKTTKHKTEKVELGEMLTKHYGVNCYWIAQKYETWIVKEAHGIAQDKGYRYFLGVINSKFNPPAKIIENIKKMYEDKNYKELITYFKKNEWKLEDKTKLKIHLFIQQKVKPHAKPHAKPKVK